MILALTFYGLLAGLACAATCKDAELRWLGAWLVLGYLISNALYFEGVAPSYRVGPYSMIEIMILTAAFCSLISHNRWPLIGVMGLNLLSIAANIALALYNFPSHRQIYIWDVTTNMCFVGECLLTIGMGVAYEYRSGRFHSLLRSRRQDAQQGAAFKDDPA